MESVRIVEMGLMTEMHAVIVEEAAVMIMATRMMAHYVSEMNPTRR